jgi:hypothetical protein
MFKYSPSCSVRSNFRSAGTGEAARRFDPQIQTRKSRSAGDAAKPVARAAGDPILQLSKGETLLQGKAADKS